VNSVLYLEIINTSGFVFNKRFIFFGILITNWVFRTIKRTKKAGIIPLLFTLASAWLPKKNPLWEDRLYKKKSELSCCMDFGHFKQLCSDFVQKKLGKWINYFYK